MITSEKYRWGISAGFWGPIEINKLFLHAYHHTVKDGTFTSKEEVVQSLEVLIKKIKEDINDNQ